MKLNLGVEDRRGVCPSGFLYGGTMGGAGDRKGRPYERVTSSAVGGRTEASTPTEGYKGADAERNPPVTASPCQPPLGKGAYTNRENGLPQPVFALVSQ